jgi:hypothetical protein
VDYEFSASEVIDLVQDAVSSGEFGDTKNLLAGENDQQCNLN